MRQMKPLILPSLVAARKSSKGSFDMAYEPASSVHSSTDSGFYSISECSTPPTPSFSARSHLRYPSSTSSLSSSPPAHEPADAVPNASGKLPLLAEEPVERDEDFVTVETHRCSCDSALCTHEPPPPRRAVYGQAYDFAEDYFSNDSASHMTKRRRSVESTTNSISSKIETRFPSLSRKMRERKRASTFGRNSRSTTPSRQASLPAASTRSSSMTSSIHRVPTMESPAPIRRSKEHLEELMVSSPIDVAKANAFEIDPKEVEAERYATTPLLPPMLVTTQFADIPTQSPLQSPTVADSTTSLVVTTPMGTPPLHAFPTPPLSTQPSVSSFRASRPGYTASPSEIPPMMLADPSDKWVDRLGHANFTIEPQPYLPQVFNAITLHQLFADWERARRNFTKHQVRTAEHYGVTSKTYLLTEKKWAEIDALWKTNNDLAMSRAAAMGAEPKPTSPMEPAPLTKMPLLSDPKSEGKFPKLGDEDIVGPMVQIAAQIQKTPARKRAFFKFFGDIKFPGSLLGKSSAAIRPR